MGIVHFGTHFPVLDFFHEYGNNVKCNYGICLRDGKESIKKKFREKRTIFFRTGMTGCHVPVSRLRLPGIAGNGASV